MITDALKRVFSFTSVHVVKKPIYYRERAQLVLYILFIGGIVVWLVGDVYTYILDIALIIFMLGIIMKDVVRRSLLKRYRRNRKYLATNIAALWRLQIERAIISRDGKKGYYKELPITLYPGGGGLYEIDFDYGSKKLTEPGEKMMHYTVFFSPLQREVPHIVFDSHLFEGFQLERYIADVQEISVDMDTNRYFRVYVPMKYHVDVLSFISPEVLMTLHQLKGYDVELIGKRLYVFGPILSDMRLKEFEANCLQLAKYVNGNIKNYKDDRLSGRQRDSQIMVLGKDLLKNPKQHLYTAFMFLGILAFAAFIPRFQPSFEESFMWMMVIGVVSIVGIIRSLLEYRTVTLHNKRVINRLKKYRFF